MEDLVARAKQRVPGHNLSLYECLRASGDSGMLLAAEFKRASPSKGDIRSPSGQEVNLDSQIESYIAGGASVISVLTEGRHF